MTHSQLRDLRAGTVGWNKNMQVVGKRVAWDTGTHILDVIDTVYHGKRFGLVAPSGTVDYASASQAVKDTYAFVGDLSDGSANYVIA